MRFLLSMAVVLGGALAEAVELKFGPEFTISNSEIQSNQRVNGHTGEEGLTELRQQFFKNPTLKAYHLKLIDHLQKKLITEKSPTEAFQLIRKRVESEDRLVFQSPNGWQVMLGLDPGVFEWTMPPMTLAELKAHREEIQYVLFDLPKEIGLEPMLFSGGGHINIGAEPFENNRELLRRFVIDFLNHSELSMGIFNYDTNNALNYWLVQKMNGPLRRTLEDLRRPEAYLSNKEFAVILSQILSAPITDEYLNHFREPSYFYTNVRRNSWALAFKHDQLDHHENIFKGWRLEIRSVRPQTSFDVFLRQAELLQKRLDFIERTGGTTEAASRLEIYFDRPFEDRLFNPPVDPQAALKSFYEYVTESGPSWQDHQDYLWPMWISGGELTKFNQSLQPNCETLLSEQRNNEI